jgi:nucleoside-diphosphate-sugar epimerase
LTGGTGFLGSHILVGLLRKDYRVLCLVRPNKHEPAKERLLRLLGWFGADPSYRSSLHVLEGSLEYTNLGLSRETYEDLREYVEAIIHAASNTSFSKRNRQQIEAANITGLANLLGFAEESSCAHFHHLSTAYVAGKRDGLCTEELVEIDEFTNVYEETKYRAERMVEKTCRRSGIPFTLYRPSIAYGDSETGRSLRFNALYYPVRTALILKHLYENDIRAQGGRRAAAMNVHLDADGTLHLPIRIEVDRNSGVNLIPVDYFVNAFITTMEESPEGGIFHIVNNRPTTVHELIDFTQRLFHIKGVEGVDAGSFERSPKSPLESLFDSYLEPYLPYMNDTRMFDNSKAEKILRPKEIRCREFDFEVFSRCMRYAIKVGWGARLFD